jgi:hypothetical protein
MVEQGNCWKQKHLHARNTTFAQLDIGLYSRKSVRQALLRENLRDFHGNNYGPNWTKIRIEVRRGIATVVKFVVSLNRYGA